MASESPMNGAARDVERGRKELIAVMDASVDAMRLMCDYMDDYLTMGPCALPAMLQQSHLMKKIVDGMVGVTAANCAVEVARNALTPRPSYAIDLIPSK